MNNEIRELSTDQLDLVSGGASLLDVAIGLGISIAANIIYDGAKSGGIDAIDTKAAAQWLHLHPH